MSQQSQGNPSQRGGGRPWQSRGRGQRGSGYRRGGGYNRGRGNWRYNGGSSSQSGRPPPASYRQAELESQLGNSPYKGWRKYFPEEAYVGDSPTVVKVKAFEKFFSSKLPQFDKEEIENQRSVCVDYTELRDNEKLMEAMPNFREELKEMPELILKCLGLAVHQVLTKDLEQQAAVLQQQTSGGSHTLPFVVHVPVIHARIVNFEPIASLKHLKANYYGKFVSIKGTVVRVSNIKPVCTKMAFECNMCGDIQVASLPDGKYVLPTKCLATGCRGRSFSPKQSSLLTETVDWQIIKVQEIVMDDQREAGRIPRTVECEMTNDLVDSCVPGDTVTVSGVVKVSNVDEGRGRNKDKCMFLLYIQANSISNLKRGKKVTDAESSSGVTMDFNIKELYAVQEIQSQPNLFKLIVGSLSPAIYGHEMVKAGLLLGLFGGAQKFVGDKNRIPVRGDPHILVVGDPGLGKSQMLTSAANVAPRGVYVCGNTTTASGLTVTLSRDSATGDFALEAGALVLGDQGCCCIDEFDKMGTQHQALLEAMEQQSISIAKAGVVCSLPARTSILAAANPIGGHYNKAKTVSENLKMSGPLLSRFDLVFILLDKPDEDMDSMLSEHVMAQFAGRHKRNVTGDLLSPTKELVALDGDEEGRKSLESQKPLPERLKIKRGEELDLIPPQLLRKYIAYARKYVQPQLTVESARVLQNFYLELRRTHQGVDSTPITTRQLESMIRLTEARARVELREKTTEQDAQDVIDLMKFSMIDTYSDQFGFLDFQRSQHGSGMSSRSQAKRFISILNGVAERTYNNIFTVQQMREIAMEASIRVPDFEGFIASLNNQSYLLKKGPRVYQLQTAAV
ncbi:DNA helicase MCM8 [Holothuria leucospilota]|uniref:DNA helicase MCM8 n=1 Tax=Holothuria leucospilota TaxID=206669 RepID=A0A9Q1HDP2_HOLLE|nr:DNA helicase MCM8 [Holothuria leucospilota]